MKSSPIRYFLGLAALLGFLLPALAAGDPPGRVGRLSQVDGDVIFRADRQDPGHPATINWPVSSGAIIDTERRARAEIWIGSTAYRLGENSRAEFVTVNDRIVDLLLASGTLAVTIRDRDQADDLQISTPGGRVRFPGPGRFRIEVRPERTSVAAQSGSAEVLTGERPLVVRPGEIATLDERGLLGVDAAPYGDDFDTWVSAQDNRERSNATRRYVSPHMTGYQDLDAYGDWGSAPDYGTVWYPRAVAADWAPYRDGRWAWVAPWGWTWVDAAPWGFAPFHYGRWVEVGGRWGWAPGAYAARPVYAPALVGWVGDPGWNVRFGAAAAPAVGWFPLAPREVYVPGYPTSPTYVRQINITHVNNYAYIDRAQRPEYRPNYAYQGQPQAVTVVPANTLREGRAINRDNIRPYDRNALDQAPVRPRAPGGDWVTPQNGAVRATQQGQAEHYPQRQQIRPPAERFQPPASAASQAGTGPGDWRGTPQPSGRSPDVSGRYPGADAARTAPEYRRNMDNPARAPSPEAPPKSPSAASMPQFENTRPQVAPQPAIPAPTARDERARQAAPAMREIQPPTSVQHEQQRDIYRQPQPYREAPQMRQPPPERAASMPRETPQQQFQPQPRMQPQHQPQPSAPPMREMPRPPPQPDQHRGNRGADERHGDRGQGQR